MKTLHLIRGLPGTGKSTIAQLLCDAYQAKDSPTPKERRAKRIEYDSFWCWIHDDLHYQYEEDRVWEAHGWCESQVYDAMLHHIHHVIVDNIFVCDADMLPYKILAQKFGYKIQEIVVQGESQSIHSVEKERIQDMAKNFEFTMTAKFSHQSSVNEIR